MAKKRKLKQIIEQIKARCYEDEKIKTVLIIMDYMWNWEENKKLIWEYQWMIEKNMKNWQKPLL